jgi:hypothetical protein
MDVRGQQDADEVVVCSAKGCRAPAEHLLVWNNPKVHAPEREKTWVACEDHRSSLADHLDVRGFLRRVDALRPCVQGSSPHPDSKLPPDQKTQPG